MEEYTMISYAGEGLPFTVSVDADTELDSLNAQSSECSCNFCCQEEEQFVNFIRVGDDIYVVQLKSNTEMYLTADSKEDGANIRWTNFMEEADCQKWKIIFTVKNYILVNSWLKLYKNQTASGGRIVQIPEVNTYTGSDGHTYQFTNKKYWYAYENPYKDSINPFAVTQIRKMTGKNPTVIKGAHGELTDGKGNYWMAIGPNVVNPNHKPNAQITAEEMYGRGKLDIAVKDDSGHMYYIPGVIGDAKAHSWSNGVVQTWKSYPSGAFTSAGGNFNGLVCAEFIGSVNLSGLNHYSIEKIIFYPNS